MGTSATVRLIEGVRLIRCQLNTGFTVPAETMHGTLLTVRLETFWNLTNFRGTITSSFISSGVNLYRMKDSVPLLYKSYWMANNQNNSLIIKKKRWGMAETTPLTSFFNSDAFVSWKMSWPLCYQPHSQNFKCCHLTYWREGHVAVGTVQLYLWFSLLLS